MASIATVTRGTDVKTMQFEGSGQADPTGSVRPPDGKVRPARRKARVKKSPGIRARATGDELDDHCFDEDEPATIPAPPVGHLVAYYHNDKTRDLPGVYRPRMTRSSCGQEVVLDAYGIPAPAGVGDTFADPSIRQILANIASVADDAEQVREQFNELKAARKSHQIYTWAEIPTVSKLFDVIRDSAVKLADHLRDAIPYAVCPDCSGSRRGCKACRGSGYWPKSECEVYPDRFRKGAGS